MKLIIMMWRRRRVKWCWSLRFILRVRIKLIWLIRIYNFFWSQQIYYKTSPPSKYLDGARRKTRKRRLHHSFFYFYIHLTTYKPFNPFKITIYSPMFYPWYTRNLTLSVIFVGAIQLFKNNKSTSWFPYQPDSTIAYTYGIISYLWASSPVLCKKDEFSNDVKF